MRLVGLIVGGGFEKNRAEVQQIFYVGPIFFTATAKNRADKSHRVRLRLPFAWCARDVTKK